MENEELKQRREEIRKKSRFYLYAGYIMFLIGLATLIYTQLGFIIILGGIFMRVLYYLARLDLKAINRLDSQIKIIAALLIPLCCLLLPMPAHALQPGQRATELERLVWLKGEPVKIFQKDDKEKKFIVIECWASWDRGSQLAIPVLAGIQKKYPDDIVIIGISKEKKAGLNNYLKVNGKNIPYRIAHDPSGATLDIFSGEDSRIPLVLVIDKDGKVLYRGHPMELENVIKNIIAGTFDLNKQQKISKLQQELQNFLQLEDIRQVINTSEKILALDPANDLAMRVRLFVFESKKELPQALLFIDKQIAKNPETVPLYFIKLDLMQRTNVPVGSIQTYMKDIYEKFKDNPDALHQLAWIAVNQIRFGTAPLEVILKASKKSVELQRNNPEQDSAKLANFLSTQAKTFYMAGLIDQAVTAQEKTCQLLKNEAGENEAKQLLAYYQDARKLNNKESGKPAIPQKIPKSVIEKKHLKILIFSGSKPKKQSN